MIDKSLFENDLSYTLEAQSIRYRTEILYKELLDEYVAKGFSPREIEMVFLDVPHTITARRILEMRRATENRVLVSDMPTFKPGRRVLCEPLQLMYSVNELGSLLPVGTIIKTVGYFLFESGLTQIDIESVEREYSGSRSLLADELCRISKPVI